MTMPLKPLTIIGGWDPSGGAGLIADLRVLEKYHQNYQAIPTAWTQQTHRRWLGFTPTPLPFFKKCLAGLPKKIPGVKIGMLATMGHLKIIKQWLSGRPPKWVVWDPVFWSSTGGKLLKVQNWNSDLKQLLGQTTHFTPNLAEAEWILQKKISNKPEIRKRALQEIFEMGKRRRRYIFLKGGHDPQAPRSGRVQDWLWDGRTETNFQGPWFSSKARGTGCTLASALLVHLNRGEDTETAYRRSRRDVKNLCFKK